MNAFGRSGIKALGLLLVALSIFGCTLPCQVLPLPFKTAVPVTPTKTPVEAAPTGVPLPEQGQVLRLPGNEPQTLDPALVEDVDSSEYVVEIFSGLVSLNEKLEVVPDMAERWEVSEDGRTYTFHLRKDVRFHDGKAVTAADFKYSLERVCDPRLASKVAPTYLGDIVGVKEVLAGKAKEIAGLRLHDDYTLELTIDQPKSYFLAKLTYPTAFVVDKANVEGGGKNWYRSPNGTGPFKLAEWKKDELIVLQRNELYYGGAPALGEVSYILDATLDMYEQGELDLAYVGGASLERVQDPANPLHRELTVTPELSISYIGFNVEKPPFDDVKVRQAFAHATNKEKLVTVFWRGSRRKADGLLPPGMPGYDETFKGLPFDPARAKSLIAESKYREVAGLPPVTITTIGAGGTSPYATALAEMFKQNLGVNVAIQQVESAERYYGELAKGRYQLFTFGWIADYPDPQDFLDILFHSDSSAIYGTNYHNTEYDRIVGEARAEPDQDRRMDLYRKAQALLIDDAPCVPISYNVRYTLTKPYVKGVIHAPLTLAWLRYVSIQHKVD